MNPVEIEQAISELAEAPFDAAEFPFAFLEAFGRKTLVSPESLRPVRLRHDMGHEAPNSLRPAWEKALAWSPRRRLCFQTRSRVVTLLRAAMLQPRVPLGGCIC